MYRSHTYQLTLTLLFVLAVWLWNGEEVCRHLATLFGDPARRGISSAHFKWVEQHKVRGDVLPFLTKPLLASMKVPFGLRKRILEGERSAATLTCSAVHRVNTYY